MTYLLHTPSNKGNVSRDLNGNKLSPAGFKKCSIHNAPKSYFTSLSDFDKETCCLHVIRHLRKYFKIIDCKSEWIVVHHDFVTNSLTEEIIDKILPGTYDKSPKKGKQSSTRDNNRKRSRLEYEDESFANFENPKRPRHESYSDVSSVVSSEEEYVVNSPDFSQPSSQSDLMQSAVTYDGAMYGDFHDVHNYVTLWDQTLYPPRYYSSLYPEYYNYLGMSQETSDLVQFQFPSTLDNQIG